MDVDKLPQGRSFEEEGFSPKNRRQRTSGPASVPDALGLVGPLSSALGPGPRKGHEPEEQAFHDVCLQETPGAFLAVQ